MAITTSFRNIQATWLPSSKWTHFLTLINHKLLIKFFNNFTLHSYTNLLEYNSIKWLYAYFLIFSIIAIFSFTIFSRSTQDLPNDLLISKPFHWLTTLIWYQPLIMWPSIFPPDTCHIFLTNPTVILPILTAKTLDSQNNWSTHYTFKPGASSNI